MAYLTIGEYKNRIGVLPEITQCEDENKIAFLLEYCSLIIDSYTNTNFSNEVDKTIYVDGEGTNKLFLPERIYNIKSISTYDNLLIYDLTDLLITDKNMAILNRKYDFNDGDQNIMITGDFGWETVPDPIITCLVSLCNSHFYTIDDEDLYQKIAGPFSSEKIGNYSYQLRDRLNNVTGEEMVTTGDSKVDQILDKYKIDRILFGVI